MDHKNVVLYHLEQQLLWLLVFHDCCYCSALILPPPYFQFFWSPLLAIFSLKKKKEMGRTIIIFDGIPGEI